MSVLDIFDVKKMGAAKLFRRREEIKAKLDQDREIRRRYIRLAMDNEYFKEFVTWVSRERDRMVREASGDDAFTFGQLKGIQSVVDRLNADMDEARETKNVRA